jgi:hypothetical protein
MKTSKFIAIAAFATLANSAAFAAPAEPKATEHSHDMPMSKDGDDEDPYG